MARIPMYCLPACLPRLAPLLNNSNGWERADPAIGVYSVRLNVSSAQSTAMLTKELTELTYVGR